MALPSTWAVGTASLTNGTTAITFADALLGSELSPNVMAGDLFCDPAQPDIPPQRIASVDYANSTAELWANWPGTTMASAAYEVRYVGDVVRSTAQTRRLLEELSVVKANGSGRFYRFSTTTTDADPGAGYLRLNHATIASATAAFIDNTDANGGAFGAVMDTWDDSTSLIKGQLWLMGIANKATFHAFSVAGSVVDGTGYRKVTLEYIGGSGSFADDEEFMLATTRTGDQGAGYEYDAEAADASGLTAHEGEAAGFKVWLDDLGTDFGAYSGRGGVVRLIAGPDWEVVAIYTGPQGEQGVQGIQGEQGIQGVQGDAGWAMEPELVIDGQRIVIRVADWIGGVGTKPGGIGDYVGITGLTSVLDDAIDIRGGTGSAGPKGVDWQGAWNIATNYSADAVVTDPDLADAPAAWIALAQNVGSKPRDNPADWDFFPGSFSTVYDYGSITDAATLTHDYGTII